MSYASKLMVLSLLVNQQVFAGGMGEQCLANNLTTSCSTNSWDFVVKALYLQPIYGADYGYFGSFTNEIGTRIYNTEQPKWGWSYNLQMAYHFNQSNDINVNWYHFNKSYRKQFTTATALAPEFDNASFKPSWDAVNIELGQLVDIGSFKRIHIIGGGQYTKIRIKQTNTTFASALNNPVTLQQDLLKFNGFGPRFGADLTYALNPTFAIYAKGASSVLIGTNKFSRRLQTITTTTRAIGSKNTLVPEIDGGLGVKYNASLAQGIVVLDAGYLWINYFKVLHVGHVNERVIDKTYFALNGPYLGFKWEGSI